MSESHWPTYADGLFWCACDNSTYPSEDAWLDHAVKARLRERLARGELGGSDASPDYIADDPRPLPPGAIRASGPIGQALLAVGAIASPLRPPEKKADEQPPRDE